MMLQPINQHSYIVDPEDPAETMRLQLLDEILTREMGMIFPPDYKPPAGHLVLDLACGPGGWARTVAKTFPQLEVIGVDISQKMIRYAQAQTGLLALDNASFQKMDIRGPLTFPDATFAFVNARLISGLLSKEAWAPFLQECLRILEPGGILRLTDGELPFTNGLAHEQFTGLTARALWLDGRSFIPEGKHSGIGATLMLTRFLSEAGIADIKHQAYALDFSFGTEAHDSWHHNLLIAYQLLQPFLLKQGVITQTGFEQLYEQMIEELQSPDFRGVQFFLSVWGSKPADSLSVA